jgi:hypothetical protein
MSPRRRTPLADALLDVKNTLVAPPFGDAPADEQRYQRCSLTGCSPPDPQ